MQARSGAGPVYQKTRIGLITSPQAEASKASLISAKAKVWVSFSMGNFPAATAG